MPAGLGALGALLTAGVLAASSAPASAHPEGREFLVNQYAGLVFAPDRVRVTAVLNTAEIVTTQDRRRVDADHDGVVTDSERAGYAGTTCTTMAADLHVRVNGENLHWTVVPGEYRYEHGSAGLPSARLTCELTSPAGLSAPATVTIDNRYDLARPGWHEMTARGDGVHVVEPLLPPASVSDELRAYPPVEDLTVDVRTATLQVAPGPAALETPLPTATGAIPAPAGPVAAGASWAQRRFEALAGGSLTPLLGALTVLAAVLLGAGHAALPGHGKTVLAAYLAGRRGRARDAVAIGATVTVSHTGAVLLVGALISAGTAVAGNRLLACLGMISGLLVVAVGIGMLFDAARGRALHPHDHDHDGPVHDHDHDGPVHDHDHDGPVHDHDHDGPVHAHDHHHGRRAGRLGLAGIGLAGGLVPSPSALVVLLASIGMGRAAFGVLLVLAYGLGMAGTLTAAGLLLLAVQRRVTTGRGRPARLLARIATTAPSAWSLLTSTLVLVVGVGLALRAAVALA